MKGAPPAICQHLPRGSSGSPGQHRCWLALRLFRENAGAALPEFRSRLVRRAPEDSNHSLVRNSGLGFLAFLPGKICRSGLFRLDFEMKLNQRLHGCILRLYYPPIRAPKMTSMNLWRCRRSAYECRNRRLHRKVELALSILEGANQHTFAVLCCGSISQVLPRTVFRSLR